MKYADGNTDYYHQYQAFEGGIDKLRIICTSEYQFVWGINEIYLLGDGTLPSWVQQWEPVQENADILVIATHPDDELLFFGGLIPDALSKGYSVEVAYFTYSNTTRRSEILNGLWSMGLRNYPVIGRFSDHYDKTLAKAYEYAGGKVKVQTWFTELIRQVKPQVVVTHSADGEYGHKQHQMVADAVQAAVLKAASETECSESIPTYGTWQVKKLYMHENSKGLSTITFDWNKALDKYDGLTATQVVQSAYAYHITQRAAGFVLSDKGVTYKKKLYDNCTFGLVSSTVGADEACDDLMEHLTATPAATAVPQLPSMLQPVNADGSTPEPVATATPAATAAPAWADQMPELNDSGFLDEGEYYVADDTNGLFIYVNQTTKIVIQRKYDATQPLTWYEAEVWSDVSAGEYLKTYFYDDQKKGKTRVDAAKNAIAHKAVFAMNTDYYTYRVGGPRRVGIVIRNGEVLYDDAYTTAKNLFPNLDTVAFYPDGSLAVAHSYEHDAAYFVSQGAENVYSFGPYLIRDGEVNPDLYSGNNLTSKNPRCAIGMVEPGHYVMILAEGRLKRSGGVTMNALALMMKSKGCTQAINLDGGQTAVMVFMGKQLNQIGKYNGKTSARQTCDIMAIGTS